jgi:hypothetical protein
VHGGQLAEVVGRIMFERGIIDVNVFLNDVDSTYDERRAVRNPSEILYD